MSGKSKDLYLEEMEGIPSCTPEEMAALLKRAAKGDEKAFERMVEGNLHLVNEIAEEYSHTHARFMDLVQEGNVALMLKLREVNEYTVETERELRKAVTEAMDAYKESENEAYRAGVELKTKLNVMDEVCVKLAEEYGREATAEEVAEKMQLDTEDVRYLMKIALSAIQREE